MPGVKEQAAWLARRGALMLAAYACARCTALGGLPAAAAALLAANLSMGGSGLPVLLGCALACMRTGSIAQLWPPAACLCAWVLLRVPASVELRGDMPAGRWVRLCLIARGRAGDTAAATLAACAASCACLLMTLAPACAGHVRLSDCIVATLLGFGFTPVFRFALAASERGAFARGDALAMALLAAVCGAGLGRDMPMLHAAASALALYVLAGQGGRASGRSCGAGVGALLGGMHLLTGDGVTAAALLLAGLVARMGMRYATALACIFAGALGGWAAGDALAWSACTAAGVALGELLLCGLAPHWQSARAGRLLKSCTDRLRAHAEQRADRLADDLSALMEQRLPMDGERDIELLRERVCGGCPRAELCWGRYAAATRGCFDRLNDAAAADTAHMLPPGCIRTDAAQSRLSSVRHELESRRAARASARAAAPGRLREELRAALADEWSGLRMDERASRRAMRLLRRAGVCCAQVCVTAGQPHQAFIEPEEGAAQPSQLPEGMRRAMLRATGVDFELAGGGDVLRLRQRSRLTVQGALRRYAHEGASCGDSAVLTRLQDGRWLAALSDGMGRGETAARESCAALAAVNRLLDEGVAPESALDIANTLLQLTGAEEMYATLDVALIDPQSGRCDLYKLGACPSLLLSGGRARMVAACAPPFGILSGVVPAHRSVRLRPGDRLALLTDGACDFSDERQGRAVQGLLQALEGRRPEEAAECIIAHMRSRYGLDDDAAVIVLDVRMRQGGRMRGR